MDFNFTFEDDISEPEVVLLERHYNAMVKDIEDMDGEIVYLRHMIEYLLLQCEEAGVEICLREERISEFIRDGKEVQ